MDQVVKTDSQSGVKSEHRRPHIASVPRVFAYLRVSTDEQDLNSQKVGIVDYSTKHGLPIARYFEEKVSGAVPAAERTLGKEVLPALQSNDILVVSEISRLGRSTLDILTSLKTLSDKGVSVHAVKNGGALDQTLNGRILTTVLGLTAEIERDLLRQRVREGQARARAAGKKIGRPKADVHVSKLDKHADAIQQYAARGVSKLNLARVFDCDWATMNLWLQRHGVAISRKRKT